MYVHAGAPTVNRALLTMWCGRGHTSAVHAEAREGPALRQSYEVSTKRFPSADREAIC